MRPNNTERFVSIDGRAVRVLRRQQGLTQRGMIEKGGGKYGGHIADLESGFYQRVKPPTYEAIVQGLGVVPEDIKPGAFEQLMLCQPLRFSESNRALNKASLHQLREELMDTLEHERRVRDMLNAQCQSS